MPPLAATCSHLQPLSVHEIGTGLHEADGEDDLLTELLQPKREAAETADKAEGSEAGEVDDEMQEADFWNGVGEEDFEVEEVEEIEATAGPVQEARLWDVVGK